MLVSLNSLFNIYTFSTGRRMYSMSLVKPIAAARKAKEIVTHIDMALAHDRVTRILDIRWDGRQQLNRGGGKLKAVDGLTDNTITAIRDGAVLQTRGMQPDDPIHGVVEAFLAEALPAGVQAITALPFVDQVSAVDAIVTKLQGPLAPVVKELGLTRQVERLAALAVEYRAALDESTLRSDAIVYEEVREAREKGQQYLLALIVLILATYRDDTPEDEEAREALLTPILQQNEAIRVYLRNRRAVRDVDPDTGLEEPVDGEPVAPAPEPAQPQA
jgi:hypothetical protein